jgi:tetratricopeptide (TPR) repeat protein
MPLKTLFLNGCSEARHFAALAELKQLETLRLPDEFVTLPEAEITAIQALRKLAGLHQIEIGGDIEAVSIDLGGDLRAMTVSIAPLKGDLWKKFDSDVRTRMARLHLVAGDYASAEPMLENIALTAKQTYGAEHHITLAAMGNLAECYASRGRFGKAAVTLRQIIDVEAKTAHVGQTSWKVGTASEQDVATLNWMRLADTLVAAGDFKGYQTLCAELLKWHHNTDDVPVAERLLRVCLLAENSGIEAPAITALIEAARPMELQTYRDWHRMIVGLAEYRAGHWAAAAVKLNEIEGNVDVDRTTAYKHVLLAMIREREQQPDQARELLDRARVEIQSHWPSKGDRGWHDWLYAHLLLKEAEKLIGGGGSDTGKK